MFIFHLVFFLPAATGNSCYMLHENEWCYSVLLSIAFKTFFFFLTWWLWPLTLTFNLDVDILPLDLHAEFQVRRSVRLSWRLVTDTLTHLLTHDVKTITPIADAGCKYKFIIHTWNVLLKPWDSCIQNSVDHLHCHLTQNTLVLAIPAQKTKQHTVGPCSRLAGHLKFGL